MLKQALFVGFAEDTLSPASWQEIANQAASVKRISSIEEASESDLAESDALIVRLGATVDQDLINQLPNLRFVGMFGTGFGRIDTAYATERGIVVSNVQDYATESVAEFTVGALIAHFREFGRARVQANAGDFSEDTFVGRQLSSLSVGVIGLGNIGRRVAEIAADGFGCNVKYWSASSKEISNKKITAASIEEVLSTSDVVSLNVALNPQTEGILNAERIGLLKTGAVLINTAPMDLIDLAAIEKRLKAGEIHLIFDHPDEMQSEDAKRLTAYESTATYPPIGYTTSDASQAKEQVLVENLTAFVSGKPQNKVS